ncbi:MAG: membrane protein insertase YidC [Patescibacteria group bacterium]|nr:membrane protein insertase YidC [Patescibacteria group bacterium]
MFQALFYTPFLNALIVLYNTVAFHDLGVAIILLTLVIRLIFLPLFYSGARNQSIIQKLQPEIKKIQNHHKDDKEKQAQAMMELYRTHNVNPFSGFLMLLIQLPVLIGIYRVFLGGITPEALTNLYSFVSAPAHLNATFLHLIDLQKPSILMVILAAAAQYYQGKLSLPKLEPGQELSSAEQIGRQMIFMGPVITVVILGTLPAAIGLYWLVTSVFTVIQQIYINRTLNLAAEIKEHHLP